MNSPLGSPAESHRPTFLPVLCRWREGTAVAPEEPKLEPLVLGEGTTLSLCRLPDWRLSKSPHIPRPFTGCFGWTYVYVFKPCRAGMGNPQPGDNLKPVKVFNPACLTWTNYINCINYMNCKENVKKTNKQKNRAILIFSCVEWLGHASPWATLQSQLNECHVNTLTFSKVCLRGQSEVAETTEAIRVSEPSSNSFFIFLSEYDFAWFYFFYLSISFWCWWAGLITRAARPFQFNTQHKGNKKTLSEMRESARLPARSDRQRSSNWKA